MPMKNYGADIEVDGRWQGYNCINFRYADFLVCRMLKAVFFAVPQRSSPTCKSQTVAIHGRYIHYPYG